MFRSQRVRVSALLALAVASGLACGPKRAASPTAPRDQYLILAQELEATQQATLYDAVRRARPNWFTRATRERANDNTLVVYADDQLIGSADALRRFAVDYAVRVRYLSPTEAQVRYGQNNRGRPAILIETRE